MLILEVIWFFKRLLLLLKVLRLLALHDHTLILLRRENNAKISERARVKYREAVKYRYNVQAQEYHPGSARSPGHSPQRQRLQRQGR